MIASKRIWGLGPVTKTCKPLGRGGVPQVQSLAELQRLLEASLANLIRVSQRGLKRHLGGGRLAWGSEALSSVSHMGEKE